MTSSIILTYLFPTDNNRCTAADNIQEKYVRQHSAENECKYCTGSEVKGVTVKYM